MKKGDIKKMFNTKKELLKNLIGKGCEIEEDDNYINISIGPDCRTYDEIMEVGDELFKVKRYDIYDYYYSIDHFHSLKYSEESIYQESNQFG